MERPLRFELIYPSALVISGCDSKWNQKLGEQLQINNQNNMGRQIEHIRF